MTSTSTPHARELALGMGLGALVGLACGLGSAWFLWLLDVATGFRTHNEGIVFALPLFGLALGLAYERWGGPIQRGSNLLIDTIHDGGPEVPLRMAPMVLFGTVLTHLFGGSAGREGTAVQIGGSLADWIAHRLRLPLALRRQLLIAGVAGGFGSVFGTPVAGAVFGIELIVRGRLRYEAIVPAMIASVVGDWTTRACGIGHAHYPSPASLALTPLLLGKWLVFAVAVAITSTAFIELIHLLKKLGERHVRRLPARLFLGGATVVLLWQGLGTSDYLGLGLPTIARAFEDPALPAYTFVAKLLFTAVTLGAGFIGGEVTPLFFVGAALGNLLARLLGLPLELGVAVGLAAVFAASSNTPLALSIMAVELVGASVFPHAAIVCFVAFALTGHRSIYAAQRVPDAPSQAPPEERQAPPEEPSRAPPEDPPRS